MNVPEITEVKIALDQLKTQGVIKEWELPYENLLTRRSAAIFFVSPPADKANLLETAWKTLGQYDDFSYRENIEKKLSVLSYRVTFNEEEKRKNGDVQS